MNITQHLGGNLSADLNTLCLGSLVQQPLYFFREYKRWNKPELEYFCEFLVIEAVAVQ